MYFFVLVNYVTCKKAAIKAQYVQTNSYREFVLYEAFTAHLIYVIYFYELPCAHLI